MSQTEKVGRGDSCGKAILIAEHAVVYGVTALVAGLNRGAQARVCPGEEDQIVLPHETLSKEHDLYLGLQAIRTTLESPPLRVELDLQLPPGCGLGASAAIGVAMVRAIADLKGELDERAVARAADVWENVFHGNASGIDAAAARLGGVLRFTKGHEPEPIPLRAELELAIAQAGPPASTKLMVETVRRHRERNPAAFEKNLQAFQSLSENAAACLRGGDLVSLGKLFDLAQMLLASWMVSSEEIERACALARENGASGAKLTGAGGGGAVIAVGDTKSILAAWQKAGIPAFSCKIGNHTH